MWNWPRLVSKVMWELGDVTEGLMWPLVSVQLGDGRLSVLLILSTGGSQGMVCFASSLPTPHPLTQSTLTGLSHSFTHVKSSPQHQEWIGLCAPWFAFVPSPPAISSTHPIHPNRSQPFLHSHQILTSHQEWIGLCVPWFALSISPPSHPLTQSTPTGLSIPLLASILPWLAFVPIFTQHLVCNPPSQSPHSALARQIYGYAIGGLGAHWMWVPSDVHTSWYSLSMACLRCFSCHPSFFIIFFFLGGGGLEAVNPGQVFILSLSCNQGCIWTWMDLDKFCNEMDQKGESMLVYIA